MRGETGRGTETDKDRNTDTERQSERERQGRGCVGSRERQVIKDHHPLGRHSVPPFCTRLTHSRTNRERGKHDTGNSGRGKVG